MTKQYQHAIFDFDGTISLLRAGWARILADCAVDFAHERYAVAIEAQAAFEHICASAGTPSQQQLEALLSDFGMPRAAGAACEAAYQERLHAVVDERRQEAAASEHGRKRWMVPGTLAAIEHLAAQGCTLSIVSGTVRADVVLETRLLGLEAFFGERIHGPCPEDPQFTKDRCVARMIESGEVDPAQTIGFGDGPVETRCLAGYGAAMIGIACVEEPPFAAFDEDKSRLLQAAGAQLVVADYRDWLNQPTTTSQDG